MVAETFKAWHNGKHVTVTAVLQRTAVIILADVRTLVRKDMLFVEEGFTLARVDPLKLAMRKRAANGWRTNWRRRGLD